MKNLKSKRKSSPTCNLKFNIDMKTLKYLKDTFEFPAKFKKSNQLLSKYNLKRQRCHNERYYTTANDFEFKINRGRKLKYNQLKDGRLISREITSNHTLSISFFVKNFP